MQLGLLLLQQLWLLLIVQLKLGLLHRMLLPLGLRLVLILMQTRLQSSELLGRLLDLLLDLRNLKVNRSGLIEIGRVAQTWRLQAFKVESRDT